MKITVQLNYQHQVEGEDYTIDEDNILRMDRTIFGTDRLEISNGLHKSKIYNGRTQQIPKEFNLNHIFPPDGF